MHGDLAAGEHRRLLQLRPGPRRFPLRSRVVAAVVLQALLAAASASAKKVYLPGYGPPPYPERFLHSLAGLGPLALIAVVLCVVVMRYFGRCPASAIRALAMLAIALVVAGSLVAATDDLNDELYEPWLSGSFFLALIPSIAVWLSARRRSIWVALVALISAVPSWVAIIFASIAARFWLYEFLSGSW